MNGLNEAQQAALQLQLAQRKAALQGQLAYTSTASSARDVVNEAEASPVDNASARTLNALVNESAEHNIAQLAVIKHALGKFDDGSYGLCESCGEDISPSRLQARPEARFCIACQTRMEKARR